MTTGVFLILLLQPFFGDSVHTALLHSDGRIETVWGTPSRVREGLSAVHHGWVWADKVAPHKVYSDQLDDEALRTAKSVLRVRVPGSPQGRRELIAAPLAMWNEVPEGALPRWIVPRNGRLEIPVDPEHPWRLRVAGTREGSWWRDVPTGHREAEIKPAPAESFSVMVLDARGRPLPNASLHLFRGGSSRSAERGRLAFIRSDGRGIVSLASVPDAEEVFFTATHLNHAPVTFRARLSSLPAEIRLPEGGAVTGRFTDAQGRPVGGVSVMVEGWLEGDGGETFARRAGSAEDGTWRVAGLLNGRLMLYADREGFVPFSREVKLEGAELDLGTLRLAPGFPLAVEVVDETGRPMAGAEVRANPGESAFTDSRGEVRLADVPRDGQVTVSARLDGYISNTVRLTPPRPEKTRIVLTRAFVVRGRLVDAEDRPVEGGRARAATAGMTRSRSLPPDGELELDLPPGQEAELTLSSPSTQEVTLRVPAGEPGEVRDLGLIRASAGLAVAGRVLDAPGGRPVPGASVWALRSGASPVLSWMHRDLLEVRTGEDGAFLLKGLPRAPATLRVDAPGFARREVAIQPQEGQERHEVGEVVLSSGATVRVSLAGDPGEPAVARLDAGGRNRPFDVREAPLLEGEALFENVSTGKATVTVARQNKILCEEHVTVPDPGESLDVLCEKVETRVRGRVLLGDTPAGAGFLVWMPPAGDVPEGLVRRSTGGLRRTEVFSSRLRALVQVEVQGDGFFISEDLRPGTWDVQWFPESGGTSETPQRVVLPKAAEHEVTLRYGEAAVRGIVTDEEGQPVPRARVRESHGGAVALTDDSGRFLITGLGPGHHLLQARLGERMSELAEVEVREGETPEPLRLVLRKTEEGKLRFHVVSEEEKPVAGALVILEAEGQSPRVLTADAAGKAEVTLLLPHPPRVRIAALTPEGNWALGDWTSLSGAGEGLILRLNPTGGLQVKTKESQGFPQIIGPRGWDLSKLHLWLGSRLEVGPDRPLALGGLPPGEYLVTLGKAYSRARVQPGEQAEAEIE